VNKKSTPKEVQIHYRMSVMRELLLFMIPSDLKGRRPGGDILLEKTDEMTSEELKILAEGIDLLTSEVLFHGRKNIDHLTSEEKNLLFSSFSKKNIRLFNKIAHLTLRYYYTDSTVLRALGTVSIPPFPDGNMIPEGDLLLLESVYLRGPIFRKC
jgi:hypothetical protein